MNAPESEVDVVARRIVRSLSRTQRTRVRIPHREGGPAHVMVDAELIRQLVDAVEQPAQVEA